MDEIDAVAPARGEAGDGAGGSGGSGGGRGAAADMAARLVATLLTEMDGEGGGSISWGVIDAYYGAGLRLQGTCVLVGSWAEAPTGL